MLLIFNDSEAGQSPSSTQGFLRMVNSRASVVWNDLEIPYADRLRQCREITNAAVELNDPKGSTKSVKVSPETNCELGKIFRKVYGKAEKALLIGQANEEAYRLQDKYACQVVSLLESVDRRIASRAAARLHVAHGRSSIPLLCMSSATGLWELCQSPRYKDAVSLVSQPRLICTRRLANPWKSFTSGSSRLQRCQKHTRSAVTTSPRSIASSDRRREGKSPCLKL